MKRSVFVALALAIFLAIPSPALASHQEPTAPLRTIDLVLTDNTTGLPLMCGQDVTTPEVRMEGFATFADVPSEHIEGSFNVKRGGTGSKNQWNSNWSSQNHGMHTGSNTTRTFVSHNLELAKFAPQTWTFDYRAEGNESMNFEQAKCTIRKVNGLPPDPIQHTEPEQPTGHMEHEATAPMTSLAKFRVGKYPGLNKNPFDCQDGDSVHSGGAVRIEPVLKVSAIPSEHWDWTLEFFRFGELAWDMTVFHQNFGNHSKIGNKGELTQSNNYDFDQFPAGDYEVRITVEGLVSHKTFAASCPFRVKP